MEANELRIGNWIDTGKFHLPRYRGNHQMREDWFKYANKFTPILLTEERLLKSGFEYNNVCYTLGRFKIFIHKNKDFEFTVFYRDSCIINNAKHMHTLQNIFFILTDTELICTP